MKRILRKAVCAVLISSMALLSGCSEPEEEVSADVVITDEERKAYASVIDETMYSSYWYYDTDSIKFFGARVPTEAEDKPVLDAAAAGGFALKEYSGRVCPAASVNLTHFNGEAAGIAYFYFIGGSVAGVYYNPINSKAALSLKTRNPFLSEGRFEAFEDTEKTAEFTEIRSSADEAGFATTGRLADGSPVLVSVSPEGIRLYRQSGSRVALYRSLTAFDGFVPMSAAFFDDGSYAVLLGEVVPPDLETLSESSTERTVARKVAFYDNNFSKTGLEITLDTESGSYIFEDEGYIVVASDSLLEYYSLEEQAQDEGGQAPENAGTGLRATPQTAAAARQISAFRIGHGVVCVLPADIDGNGVKEYIMTDRLDMYVYQKNFAGFEAVWSTHLSTESFDGSLYAGDLNGDGVKEIYTNDTTGTTIRYVLTEHGFTSWNENVEYGDRIYAADINGDGSDDYIKAYEGGSGRLQSAFIKQ